MSINQQWARPRAPRSTSSAVTRRAQPAWFCSIIRLGSAAAILAFAGMARPELAFASTLRTAQARQHFGWLEQLAQLANGVVPLLSMLAIVGGLIMWGIGGGGEGVMKKIGPVVAAFGVAGFILTSGSFLGIGSSVL